MPEVVGKIPEFTSDTPLGETGEEVKEAPAEKVGEEKVTPPETLPAEIKPAEELPKVEEVPGEDAKKVQLAQEIQGLEREKKDLLGDIVGLRGERRGLKTEQLEKVEKKIAEKTDELEDIPTADVAIIERILKAKGYVPKSEIDRTLYTQVKQDELNKFLDKYPEYKPENDPNDRNWNALQKEFSFYRAPEDPRAITQLLEKARRAIQVPSSEGTPLEVKKEQLKTAGVGAGGAQPSSPLQSFDLDKVDSLRRGGFSDEEIKRLLTKLQEQ